MANLNKILIIGHLGADPEMKVTNNGTRLTTFSVATNTYRKDANGEKVEETQWHRVVAWGELAEQCGTYLRTGRLVYIEGRLKTRSWEDPDGQTRYMTEVVARQVRFLDRPAEADGMTPMGRVA